MADIYGSKKRSDIMRKVRSKGNTSTELRLIALFNDNGFSGWRRNYPVMGHPDFVFLDKKIAVFVDGCFWHGHDCRNTHPKENEEYWTKKRNRNIQHDKEVTSIFESRGWTVMRIWECELKKNNLPLLIDKLKTVLRKTNGQEV
ncbi:MAG: very short patch repair endonuclease [Syntrophomonadaceae bacterium]